MSEAHSFIRDNVDITECNALALNQQLQQQLRVAKEKLEQFLARVQQKYADNVQILERTTTRQANGAQRRLRCFYFCGAPYFKTIDGFSHPPNADYKHRKQVEHEHFPIDHNMLARRWTVNDKIHLIQGVKKQVVTELVRAKCGTYAELDARKLVDLFTRVSNEFVIDWFTVSARDLSALHTPHECSALWTAFLRPELNRKPWTASENKHLQAVAKEFNGQNWAQISNQIPRRSYYQCAVQYQWLAIEQNMLKNVPWTPAEDEHLLKVIENCRIGDLVKWSQVCETITNRSKIQLYQR